MARAAAVHYRFRAEPFLRLGNHRRRSAIRMQLAHAFAY